MNAPWFERTAWLPRPLSWQGWAVLALCAGLMLAVFEFVDRRSHSVSDTLYGIVPFWVAIPLLYRWVAGKLSAAN